MHFRLVGFAVLGLIAVAMPGAARPHTERLDHLRSGVAITHWFRYPPSTDPGALRSYMSDAALADLRRAGFDHVRLSVQPELLWAGSRPSDSRIGLVVEVIRRIERADLAVMVCLHPVTWSLETSAEDRLRLTATWRALAGALREASPDLTIPEILNEPVFAGQAAAWETLQRDSLAIIRSALPRATVMVTGAGWGGVDGLLALAPLRDPNVIYSAHFYEPAELTALAAYAPALDHAALARLPFPVTDAASCRADVSSADATTRNVAAFYCALGWNAARIDARFDAVQNWARGCGDCAVHLGEFGATADLPPATRLRWLSAVRAAARARGFGWTLWGFDDVMGLNVRPPPPSRPALDTALLRALFPPG